VLEKETVGNGTLRVTFRISKHLWADRIALVGEFNNWDPHSHPMEQTCLDTDWHIALEFEAGRDYRFHYLVDDQTWMDDDHADGCEPNA
jgi:1,4-alpha-glucan branching enzyme